MHTVGVLVHVIGDVHLGILQEVPPSEEERSGIPGGQRIGGLSVHYGCACFLEALLKSYANPVLQPDGIAPFVVSGPSGRVHVPGMPVKSIVVRSFPAVAGSTDVRHRIEPPVRYGMIDMLSAQQFNDVPPEADVVAVDCRSYGFDLSHLKDLENRKFLAVKFRDRYDEAAETVRADQIKAIQTAFELNDNTFLQLNADDLRENECNISRHISWEQTLGDTLDALSGTSTSWIVRLARKAQFVLVTYDLDGALLLEFKGEKVVNALAAFSVLGIEGDLQNLAPGEMLGHDSVITAAILGGVTTILSAGSKNLTADDLLPLLQKGLAAARFLHMHGFTEDPQSPGEGAGGAYSVTEPDEGFLPKIRDAKPEKKYPIDLAMQIARTGSLEGYRRHRSHNVESDWKALSRIATAPLSIENVLQEPATWTLLDQWKRLKPSTDLNLALEVLRNGVESAWETQRVSAPVCKIGKYAAVGRGEQEAARETSVLLRQYLARQFKRPFNLAVFGNPGSGKTFLVKQIVEAVRPEGVRTKTLEFNLSNYNTVSELHGAFHRIRDVALEGRVPVVFWDEFDASVDKLQFYWLRFFLAPMSEGHFQEGQDSRPLGKSIFVFAGGRFKEYSEFRKTIDQGLLAKNKALTDKAFELHSSKGDDFERRLDAYIDLPSIDLDTRTPKELVKLRRAVILRAVIKDLIGVQVFDRKKLQISDTSAKKLLDEKHFLHGAGSMANLVSICDFRTSTRFDSTVEPSERLLRMIWKNVDSAVISTSDEEEEALEEREEV